MAIVMLASLLFASDLSAQDGASVRSGPKSLGAPSVPGAVVPSFWNASRRLERPDVSRLPTSIRFLTTDDYPPFNFSGADGALMGFNLDLARAICAELAVTCTMQAVAFDTLLEALDQNKGDAVIAGVSAAAFNRGKADFSERYLGTPARFVGRAGLGLTSVAPADVGARKVAVVAGTAHEAYLKAFFPEASLRPYPDAAAARQALTSGEVDLLFGDGIGLSLWLNGAQAAGCCRFVGGPFTESRYFGDGMSVAVKPGNDQLRRAIDYALQRVWEKGVYTDLYLRWFPVGIY
ncbi:ABC transporter substrate-binding protein [Azorhizobium oxalatiphilum]|uniref:ABC transporter substrate-binding protein n=1 Tax=Azorhizobium oxalatiphilum TaxID=980631 RepID=A0A917FK45_9HYPH|nr:transporter substrate-binding domain-containing protein [Azorhizobium oxalatiphilum]GGF87454.1 ABC transporter substrate-binding protein [Azorhizobium oxalatiphilum]